MSLIYSLSSISISLFVCPFQRPKLPFAEASGRRPEEEERGAASTAAAACLRAGDADVVRRFAASVAAVHERLGLLEETMRWR
jgi:hypothetical protein